jgi:hypothetical protein
MMATDPAGDETCPERGHAEMPIAFTQPPPSPARRHVRAPESHQRSQSYLD